MKISFGADEMKNTKISNIKVNPRLRQIDLVKVQEIAESITQIGLLHPVVVDTANNLVSGNHRIEAFKLLERDEIPATILDLDKVKSSLAEIEENVARNDLSTIELGNHLILRDKILEDLELKKKRGHNRFTEENRCLTVRHLQLKTNEELAKKIGISKSLYQMKKQIARDLTQETKATLKNTDFANQTSGLLFLSRETPENQLQVAQKMKSSRYGKNIKKCINEVRRVNEIKVEREKIKSHLKNNKGKSLKRAGISLYNKDYRDFTDAEIKEGSVDMIFTDPPYRDTELLQNYRDLAIFGKKLLKPGGHLFCYISTRNLPEILDLMRPYLKYHWMICLTSKSFHGVQNSNNILKKWKPIFWFVNGSFNNKENPFVYDQVISTSPKEKNIHEWAQNTIESDYYIETLTDVDDLIIDPFLGTGTTGVSAFSLGRRFIGYEIEKETFEIAKGRLTQTTENPQMRRKKKIIEFPL